MLARNRNVLYVVALFQGMVFYGSVATLYRQASGLTVFQITLIESIFLGLMLLLEIPWGYLADRIGYRRTIVLCNGLFCLSKLVFWRADSFAAFLAERMLLSIVLSGLSGCESAFLYLHAGSANPKRVFAIHSVMSTLGLLLAAASFSLFFSAHLRLTALLTFGTYAAAFLLSLFLKSPPEKPQGNRRPLPARALIRAVTADGRFLCYLIGCAFVVEINQTVTVFLSQIQYLESGIPVRLLGYLYLLLTSAGVAAMGAASVGKRIGEPGLLLLAGGACLLLSAFRLALVSVPCILLIRVSASLLYPLMEDAKNRRVSCENRATVLSGYSMLMSLIGVFTNLLFGWLADMHIGLAMLWGAILGGAGFVLFAKANASKNKAGAAAESSRPLY